jgi:unsaturated rhamnogalacturonyl hydrolase
MGETADFDDITKQFILMEKAARGMPKPACCTMPGIESKKERWADPKTGLSPHFWAQRYGLVCYGYG